MCYGNLSLVLLIRFQNWEFVYLWDYFSGLSFNGCWQSQTLLKLSKFCVMDRGYFLS